MTRIRYKLNWQLFSKQEREADIENIKSAITSCGGFIVNFMMFSDLALSLIVEIEESKIQDLHNELCDNLKIAEPYPNDLDRSSNREWRIMMNVSFSKGAGKLKIDVPNVPG